MRPCSISSAEEPQAAQRGAEGTIALWTEQGFAYYLAWGTTMQGWAQARRARMRRLAQMRHGLAALRGHRGVTAVAVLSGTARRGDADKLAKAAEGLTLLAEALAQAHKAGESWTEAGAASAQGGVAAIAVCRQPRGG